MTKCPLILFAIAAVLVLAAIAWTWHSRTPDLLAKSRKVLKLSAIMQSTGAPLNGCYWKSNRIVLAFDRVGDGFYESAFLLDVYSGHRTPLPKLTREVWRRQGTRGHDWAVTPDGQWLLWTAGAMNRQHFVVASRADGTVAQAWPIERDAVSFCWLRQPGTFVQLVWTPDDRVSEAYEYKLGKPLATRHLVFHGFAAGEECLGTLADGRLLTCDDNDSNCPGVGKLIAIALGGQVASATIRTVRAPEHGEFTRVQLSPDGKRLAWVVKIEHSLSNNGILARLERLIGMRDHDTLSLWTSDTNGDHMREIGALPRKDAYDELELAGWLPDRRHLAYTYGEYGEFQGSLYIVPTD